MKQSELLRAKELFPGSEIVRSFSFKAIATRGNCAHLAVLNHQLAMTSVAPRGQSALFWKKDCFECLSSRIKESGRKLRSASIA